MKRIGVVLVMMVIFLLPLFYIQAQESVWQITEVMANAVNEDTGEFVELKYGDEEEQLLSGWTISDGKEKDNLIDYIGEFDMGVDGLIANEGNILLIVDSDYGGEYNDVFEDMEIDLSMVVMITVEDGEIGNGLANSGDELEVMDSEGQVVAAFAWSSDTSNGVSWELVGNEWVKDGNSFGYVQEESNKNQDTSESQNEENQNEDSGNETKWDRFWEGGEDPVLINELMINPVGDDGDGEWIELKSYWEEDIDLSGWWICDNKCDIGSKEGGYEIGEVVLESEGFEVLERNDTKIALNNDIDGARLYDPNHDLVSSVEYDLDLNEGKSFAWDNGLKEWRVTGIVTEGLENEFEEEVSSFNDQGLNESQNEKFQDVKDKIPAQGGDDNEGYKEVKGIGLVKEMSEGVKVELEGVVSVEWGLLENKYLWMQDEDAGISVKFEEDPGFIVGDKMWIAGEVHDLTYRQTVLAEDWKKIGGENFSASILNDLDDSEDMLVQISGNITQTNGDDFYVSDGNGEYRVYIKENTGIMKPEMKKGDSFEIIGVVNEIKSGFRILPRYQNDVVKSEEVLVLPSVGFDWNPLIVVKNFINLFFCLRNSQFIYIIW